LVAGLQDHAPIAFDQGAEGFLGLPLAISLQQGRIAAAAGLSGQNSVAAGWAV